MCSHLFKCTATFGKSLKHATRWIVIVWLDNARNSNFALTCSFDWCLGGSASYFNIFEVVIFFNSTEKHDLTKIFNWLEIPPREVRNLQKKGCPFSILLILLILFLVILNEGLSLKLWKIFQIFMHFNLRRMKG